MVTCVNDYKSHILVTLEKLDKARELIFGGKGPFSHSSTELYGPVSELMKFQLTDSDQVIRDPDDAGSQVFKSQIRTALAQLKAEGLVESEGRKKGWRRVVDS